MQRENTGHAELTKIMVLDPVSRPSFLKEWNSASLVTIADA